MQAAEILKIPDNTPELLYSADPDKAKAQYRKLAMQYHPDRAPGQEAVFKKVKELYECAERKLVAGTWQIPGLAVFRTGATMYQFKYLVRHDFDLGTEYVGTGVVAYEITDANADLFDNAVRTIEAIKVPEKHRAQGVICLPQLKTHCKLLNGNHLLVIAKDPDTLRLRDVLGHYKGKIPIKHAAWMVSRMCNIRALLQYGTELAHGDLSPDTLYINPAKHTMAVVGGWWYAHRLGTRIRALPPRTMGLVGAGLGKAPIADAVLPGELVRATGRELLGDINGSRLLLDKDIPDRIVSWLRGPATPSAYSEFTDWVDKVLPAVFGPKRPFIEMPLTERDLYGS